MLDYAKKKSYRSSTKSYRWRQFIFGGLVGLLLISVALVLFIHRATPTLKTHNAATATKKLLTQTASVSQPTLMNFDFYHLLSHMHVPGDETTQQETLPINLLANKPLFHAASAAYLLQLISVHHYEDAQRFKQKLAASGFYSTVNAVTSSHNQIWYRVIMGPYSSEQQARRIQSQLNQQHITSLLLHPTQIP